MHFLFQVHVHRSLKARALHTMWNTIDRRFNECRGIKSFKLGWKKTFHTIMTSIPVYTWTQGLHDCLGSIKVITQPLSIVVGKHFTVTIIKLPNVISRILIIHLLSIYFCTSSCYVRAAICLEGRLSLLALSSVYSLTVEDGSWSTPMVPAQLSVPL